MNRSTLDRQVLVLEEGMEFDDAATTGDDRGELLLDHPIEPGPLVRVAMGRPALVELQGDRREPGTAAGPPEAAAAVSDAGDAVQHLLRCWRQARRQADAFKELQSRSHKALYLALGSAYDFSIIAAREPAAFEALLDEAGIAWQSRAPMVALAKLVFGADYDKTRLTEYAAVLSYAHRRRLGPGELPRYLALEQGGIKGTLAQERQLRSADAPMRLTDQQVRLRGRIARELGRLPVVPVSGVEPMGEEYTVLVARRMSDGSIGVVGEVAEVGVLRQAVRSLQKHRNPGPARS